jgi:phosphoglycerol transferase MdoB-like AlkP superfamily enzyme
MKARDLLVSGLLAGALAAMATVATAQTNRPPNIVVIMTDDVGWGDLGSYGGGVMRGAPTPNLDRLASEGMRFVNYYGQASCTAGRASFITGRIPIRTSLSAVLAPGDPNGLTKQTPTIAQFLKQANYTSVNLVNGMSATRRRTSPRRTASTRCTTCSLIMPGCMPMTT